MVTGVSSTPTDRAPALETDHRLAAAARELIGRRAELDAIVQAALHAPRVVVIEGEAGVGKTRLISDALQDDRLVGRRILMGHCYQLREPFPLGPVIEAVRRGIAQEAEWPELNPLVGALRPLLPEVAERLPTQPPPLPEMGAERHRTFRALVELLTAFGPTVLTLEDLHWIDDGTSDFVSYLVGEMPPDLSLVLTYRREDLASDEPLLGTLARAVTGIDGVRITLSPLTVDEVGALIGGILNTDTVSHEFVRYLHEKTGGLPFAIEEVLLLLHNRKDLILQDGRWARRQLDSLEVPSAVRDSIVARVEQLSDDTQTLLLAAAVVGPSDDRLLQEVSGLSHEQVAKALSTALSSSVIEERAGLYEFRHALARQSVYEAAHRPQCKEMHRRAAVALENRNDERYLGDLAHHFREADEPIRWAHYAEAAADVATSLYDEAAAYLYLRDAFLARDLDIECRTRLAVKLAEAALHGLTHEEAIEAIGSFLETDVDPRRRGELRYQFGILLAEAGKTLEGMRHIERAVPDLDEANPALAARALAGLGLPDLFEGDLEQYRTWSDQAVARAALLDDPVVHIAVAVDRTVTLMLLGDPGWRESWELVGSDCLSPEENRHRMRGLRNVAVSATWLGHYRLVDEVIEEATQSFERLGYVRFNHMLDLDGMKRDWLEGHWDGIEEHAGELALTSTPSAYGDADAHLVLGAIKLARGALDEAEKALADAAAEARKASDLPNFCATSTWRTRAALAREDAEEARTRAFEAVKLLEEQPLWSLSDALLHEAVVVLLRDEEIDEASRLVDQARSALEGLDAPTALASLAWASASLARAQGSQKAAVSNYKSAHDAWTRLPRPYEAALVREEWAESLPAADPEAERLLLESLETFRSLEASRDVARVQQALRQRGVVFSHRRGRKGYGTALSPREAEVARLAADGYTDKQIAAELFLSAWTVAHHIASAKRKLGVSSRAELKAPQPIS